MLPYNLARYSLLIILLSMAGGLLNPLVMAQNELPVWAKNQRHYARTLNPIAAQVMQWVEQQRLTTGRRILLKKADLQAIDAQYVQFILTSQHDGASNTKEYRTRFDFSVGSGLNLPASMEAVKSILNREIEQPGDAIIQPQENEQLIYQARVLAYWWLANLDGIDTSESFPEMNAINLQRTDGKAAMNSFQRNGGHLLRSIKIATEEAKDKVKIELIVDWKGKLVNGKSAIARFKQTVYARLQKDGSLKIERIVEQPLLPTDKPWVKLLC